MNHKTMSLVAATLALTVGSFSGTDVFAGQKKKEQRATDAEVRDINRNPIAYMDKKVNLKGEVEHSAGSTFVLDGEGFANDRILVIGKSSLTPSKAKTSDKVAAESDLKVEDKVSFTGTVRTMTVAEIEREYSTDLDPTIEVEFEGSMPVIVADLSQVKKTSVE